MRTPRGLDVEDGYDMGEHSADDLPVEEDEELSRSLAL